jgi:cell division control protein 42
MLFSVVHPQSLKIIKNKWMPEGCYFFFPRIYVDSFFLIDFLLVVHHCPNVPYLLVGTRIDQRDDPEHISRLREAGTSPITPAHV